MNDKPELPGKADYAMAFRAIALAEGLSGDAKRVAAIILGHFNTKTGQCDPGTERLMSKAKVSKRTVVNATNDLDRLGLVVKIKHGGNGFRSRYQPNWQRLRELVELDNSDDEGGEIVQNAALTRCKSVHLDSAKACTLTNNRNLSKKLSNSDGASGEADAHPKPRPVRTVSADRVQGLLRDSLRHSSVRKQQPPSVVLAQEAARHRVETDIAGLGETMRSVIDQRMTADIQHEAIIAEQKRQGGGLAVIIERVSQMPRQIQSERYHNGS